MNRNQPTKLRNIHGRNAIFLPVAAEKLILYLVFNLLLSITSPAQTTFLASSLPSQPGECNYSYFSSNVDVTSFLALDTSAPPGMPGGAGAMPQYWDFSQPQQPYETVLQVKQQVLARSALQPPGLRSMATWTNKCMNKTMATFTKEQTGRQSIRNQAAKREGNYNSPCTRVRSRSYE
jgi:hypothetical protein